ncbi:DM13 domain-containing protein [Flavobacterium sp. SUN052]|uniref:DM13 domain-containing protein n=1 Tax=Flavobacterium sp. SUN052 TaxID=3002441 RepID=UPI00237D40DB|nr:DM13 domain-containing protein [Flavobacterium sp. SUN052]MEC4004548.1 DM13 domain-containing protein [Flavobacterium sp. SUN052]
MKKTLLVLGILTLLISCEQVGELTKDGVNTTTISQISTLNYHGNFVPTSGITVTGGAKIYLDGNQYKLELENFSISSGPDLKVYLSKTNLPNDFVSLGNLTSQTVYAIPQTVDLSNYKYVLIHCQQYNHLFAIAELIQN